MENPTTICTARSTVHSEGMISLTFDFEQYKLYESGPAWQRPYTPPCLGPVVLQFEICMMPFLPSNQKERPPADLSAPGTFCSSPPFSRNTLKDQGIFLQVKQAEWHPDSMETSTKIHWTLWSTRRCAELQGYNGEQNKHSLARKLLGV